MYEDLKQTLAAVVDLTERHRRLLHCMLDLFLDQPDKPLGAEPGPNANESSRALPSADAEASREQDRDRQMFRTDTKTGMDSKGRRTAEIAIAELSARCNVPVEHCRLALDNAMEKKTFCVESRIYDVGTNHVLHVESRRVKWVALQEKTQDAAVIEWADSTTLFMDDPEKQNGKTTG